MDQYFNSNRKLWDLWTPLHVKSEFYDVEGFKAGRRPLDPIVREGVGDVAGKSLLHLQCHFGMDTLSWARLGAHVTGIDFSPVAIQAARELSREIGVPAEFVCTNLYDAPQALRGEFDIIFTSYGTVYWLPDIKGWAEVIAHFLKPGGKFFMADSHPLSHMLENEGDVKELQVSYPYFYSPEPQRWETNGSYADQSADVHGVEYGWQHSLSDIVNALIRVGLSIDELREYPVSTWRALPFMEQSEDGFWRLPARFPQIPLVFSLKATAHSGRQTAAGGR